MTDPEGVTTLERAIHLPAADALVVADVHLGRAASSRVELPVDDGGDAIERLSALLTATDPETVVLAGDLLHSFATIPRGVEREFEALLEVIEEGGATPVLVEGNHDTMLASLTDRPLYDEYSLADGETVVAHGHEIPEASAKRYVVGHDHPAVEIDGHKRPCFLYGPGAFEGADLLVAPAFTRLAAGRTVNEMVGGDFLSPLVGDVDGFHPGVRDGDGGTLWFPPLAECRRLL